MVLAGSGQRTAAPEPNRKLSWLAIESATSTDGLDLILIPLQTKSQKNTIMADNTNKSEPYFPLAGGADDGWSKEASATATCYCGAVQLAFPTEGPGLTSAFVCHCTDCRKITASMFASNFTVADSHLIHLRGRDNLTAFAQSRTIASGKLMTNYFCSTCGTLMYRVGEQFPGKSILRIGTVDDFHLHETKLKPKREIYVKDRVGWLNAIEGVQQLEAHSRPQQHQ